MDANYISLYASYLLYSELNASQPDPVKSETCWCVGTLPAYVSHRFLTMRQHTRRNAATTPFPIVIHFARLMD